MKMRAHSFVADGRTAHEPFEGDLEVRFVNGGHDNALVVGNVIVLDTKDSKCAKPRSYQDLRLVALERLNAMLGQCEMARVAICDRSDEIRDAIGEVMGKNLVFVNTPDEAEQAIGNRENIVNRDKNFDGPDGGKHAVLKAAAERNEERPRCLTDIEFVAKHIQSDWNTQTSPRRKLKPGVVMGMPEARMLASVACAWLGHGTEGAVYAGFDQEKMAMRMQSAREDCTVPDFATSCTEDFMICANSIRLLLLH